MEHPGQHPLADEAGVQPPQLFVENDDYLLALTDDEIPKEKSDVEVDPSAPEYNRKYAKGDSVHMTIVEDGVKRKAVFEIYKSRVHQSKQYWEYSLVDKNGRCDGKYYREKFLKLEKRAR